MYPNSIEQTKFTVNHAGYEYTRMPFGLNNSKIMDNILTERIGKSCFVYMNDIVMFSKSLRDHVIDIKNISFKKISRIQPKNPNRQVRVFKKSCLFGARYNSRRHKPNPDKIKAVLKFLLPTTQKEIKSFLGLVHN